MTTTALSADDTRHGTTAGHNAGCRCPLCRAAKTRYDKRRRYERLATGQTRRVPTYRAVRRIHALQALGWSVPHVARLAGLPQKMVYDVTLDRSATTYRRTFTAIAEIYEQLAGTVPSGPYVARTRAYAAEKGWAPPLAWDNIDDPDEIPSLGVDPWGSSPEDLDPVVVQRVLDGDYRIRATRAEKLAAADAWAERGWSLDDLERLTGWNIFRIRRTAARLAAEVAHDDDSSEAGEVSAA